MRVVVKPGRRQLESTKSLDVDLTVRVHQNVGDIRIVQKRLDWPQTKRLVQDLELESGALGLAHRHVFFLQKAADDLANLMS